LGVNEYIMKILPSLSIIILMTIQYILINQRILVYIYLKLADMYSDHALTFYKIILSFYALIFLYLSKQALVRFALMIKNERYQNQNPLIFSLRYCLCSTISINISNLINFDVSQLGGWIILFQFCFFLFQFISRTEPFLLILSLIIKAFGYPPLKIDDSPEKILIQKLFSGAILDFILVFIPRLLILHFLKRWINIHYLEFYLNCQLEISNEKEVTLPFILLIMCLTIAVSTASLIWMLANKKKNIVIVITEDGNFLEKSFQIFIMHNIFEIYFQDFQKLEI